MPGSRGATVLDDLPEAILVEEILVRLPSKDVLRCRAVRKSWRHATSTRDFMFAHHRRQPSLPIIDHIPLGDEDADPRRLVAFRRAAVNGKVCPVIRCANPGTHHLTLHAALDGLLLVSSTSLDRHGRRQRLSYVCNPATRQCARLPQLEGWCGGVHIAGFYRHHPSGEYRVLYSRINVMDVGDIASYYVFTVGSADDDDYPRCIWNRWPPVPPASMEYVLLYEHLPCFSRNRDPPPVMHRGSLHWIVPQPDEETAGNVTEIDDIIAFDTTGETFRCMRRPAQPGPWPLLFEVDGAIALCGTSDGTSRTDTEVWVMQDYEAGVWALMYRVHVSRPAHASPSQHDSSETRYVCRMVVLNERELLIKFPGYRLWHCHIDGELLRYVVVKCDHEAERRVCGMEITLNSLQESILPFPFFEKQEEDGVHPFIFE